MSTDLFEYIKGVLETGDHGPDRIIDFDLETLNRAIEENAEAIGAFPQYLLSFQMLI